MPKIKIDGVGEVTVGDNFLSLSHDDQNKTVEEITSQMKASGVVKDMAKASIGEVAKEAVTNIPSSAVEFAKNTVQPIIHPLDTAESLSKLAVGTLQKAERKAGTAGNLAARTTPWGFAALGLLDVAKKAGFIQEGEYEPYADKVGQFLKDRYGSVGAVKKTVAEDPVGVLADLSLILTGGGSVAARAPGLAGTAARAVSTAGRVIDPINIATRAGGAVIPKVLGITTGVGEDAIRTATRAGQEGGAAGQAFRENLSGQANIAGVVDDAKAALGQLRQERGDAYRKAMADIGADKTVLDFDQIDKAVSKAEGVQNFKGQDLSPTTAGIREKIKAAIDDWRNLPAGDFHTPEGMDALKKKVGDIRDATQYGTPERVVADGIYKAIRKTIVDQAPEYGKAMKAYEEASDIIQEIEKTLSLKPNANVDTSLRKLQSVLRNNVNTNYGRRKDLLEFLMRAGAPNLMEKLAGQALSSGTPRGLAQVTAGTEGIGALSAFLAGHPQVALGLVAGLGASSPKLVGGLAHGVGIASRFAPKTIGRSAFQIGRLQDQGQ